jgi:CTP:molybdopterin cytidylyltransferase MocA
VLDALSRAPVDEIVVVEGAYDLQADGEVRIVHCRDWPLGPGASLRCGLGALGESVDVAVVVLADGPHLAPAAIERVLGEWRRTGGVVTASYDGGRGHPLVLGRKDWTGIPDEGLRDRPARLVPCDDVGAPGDVDRPEDLSGL